LHQTQLERKEAIDEVYQTAIELKNPLTSIHGYVEIIKSSIPTTNEVLRSIHYYSDLVLNNTTNIVNNINRILKIDDLHYQEKEHQYKSDKTYKYKNITAIIADSWQDNINLLKILLGTAGINCLSATTQEEIINLACTNTPDFIIIDEKIDHNQGIQTALQLRALDCQSMLVAMTAAFKKNQHNLYIQSGFNEIITKPLDKAALFMIIDKYFSAKNIYALKNAAEIAATEKLNHNQINSNSESLVASNIFLKNISFNINALNKAQNDNDLTTMKKIVNIIRRTSGSIGLLDMSTYADIIYKSIENNNHNAIKYNLNLLIKEMKDVLDKQESIQTS
jgi:DNA-binding response OmpR family regulator